MHRSIACAWLGLMACSSGAPGTTTGGSGGSATSGGSGSSGAGAWSGTYSVARASLIDPDAGSTPLSGLLDESLAQSGSQVTLTDFGGAAHRPRLLDHVADRERRGLVPVGGELRHGHLRDQLLDESGEDRPRLDRRAGRGGVARSGAALWSRSGPVPHRVADQSVRVYQRPRSRRDELGQPLVAEASAPSPSLAQPAAARLQSAALDEAAGIHLRRWSDRAPRGGALPGAGKPAGVSAQRASPGGNRVPALRRRGESRP